MDIDLPGKFSPLYIYRALFLQEWVRREQRSCHEIALPPCTPGAQGERLNPPFFFVFLFKHRGLEVKRYKSMPSNGIQGAQVYAGILSSKREVFSKKFLHKPTDRACGRCSRATTLFKYSKTLVLCASKKTQSALQNKQSEAHGETISIAILECH